MSTILLSLIFALAATIGDAQEIRSVLPIDSPGPGYRQMRGDISFRDIQAPFNPVLSFLPAEVTTCSLVAIDRNNSQIRLVFRPRSEAKIRKYIEFNRTKPIRVEIGDYTLPIDMEKTFPWTNAVWLQPRPTFKAKTIRDSFLNSDPET